MAADPYQNRHPDEIKGHPHLWLTTSPAESPTLITVCAQCGELRTILFLNKDRWLCFKCKTEGASPPNLYPIA